MSIVLLRTFCHLSGVGPRTEARLWDAGLTSWHALSSAPQGVLSRGKLRQLRTGVAESHEHLMRGDARFFARGLPASEQWRLFPSFRDSVAYFDIETTGLGSPGDIITTIALYDGRQVRHFVQGDNLDEFPAAIEQYRMLVSYNGKCFDAPFIERYFGIVLGQAHLDLRYILRRLGYTGGLKGCERALGMDRGEMAGLDGYHAVVLWHEWQRQGRAKSLETLLAYNVADTINLETLMVIAYNRLVAKTPFGAEEATEEGTPPANPFRADPATVARVLAGSW